MTMFLVATAGFQKQKHFFGSNTVLGFYSFGLPYTPMVSILWKIDTYKVRSCPIPVLGARYGEASKYNTSSADHL